jgi:hypothetical protein
MKSYPSIPKQIIKYQPIYAFDKLDGSQIRAEWNAKKGFYKFGTKTQLIDEKSEPFGIAIPLIKEKYEQDLSQIFKSQGWESVLCFFELWGKGSFAGTHVFSEKMEITLLDVAPYKKGIIRPDMFEYLFKKLDIPKILWKGYASDELYDRVKQSKLEGMTFEGIVAKGYSTFSRQTIMFKIKSQAWLDKLKDFCKGDENLFEKLS